MKTKIYKAEYSIPEIQLVSNSYLDMLCQSGGAGIGTEKTYDDPWTKSGYDNLVF